MLASARFILIVTIVMKTMTNTLVLNREVFLLRSFFLLRSRRTSGVGGPQE